MITSNVYVGFRVILSVGHIEEIPPEATERMTLTARRHHRVLKVAHTLADLGAGDPVRRIHIAEAPSDRRLAPERF